MDEGDLERLVIDNAAFEQLDAAMNVFCPFDAVGMSRQEVRHGHFLEYILDPARPHDFGAECLRAFMRAAAATLAHAESGIAPLDVHLMELDGAVVRREYQSIDLLIEVPQEKLVVAIELKIEASEHSGQLGRYRAIVEREWPDSRHLFLFLTKRGDPPSTKDGAGWLPLPLRPVVDAFAAVAERQIGQPDARMMLRAYVGMLRRDHVNDERMDQLAAGLWREHREALEFLMSRRPDARYAMLAALLANVDEAARRISEATGLRVEADHSTRSVVRFAIADWDDAPGMLTAAGWTKSRRAVLLELKERGGAVRLEFQLGPSPLRQRVFDALTAAGADTGYAGGIGEKWRQLANTAHIVEAKSSSEEQLDQLIAATSSFVARHEPTYRQALGTVTV